MTLVDFLKFKLPALSLVAGIGLTALTAQAGSLPVRFGAQDGFGIGIGSGQTFLPSDLVSGLGDGADEWREGGFSAPLPSSWTGKLTGAQLDVFSGGWGLDGPAEVLFNMQLIGHLTVGDGDTLGDNYAFLDVFDMAPYLTLITGSDTVEIRTVNAGDAGVLGFLRLTLQTDAVGNTVPEPAMVLLVGAALAAALTARRRRR